MSLTVGEVCAGYNGLGAAVEQVFDATPAWFFEFDAAPSKILAHHYPDVPNYGDMTAVDWATIQPVDIISGGTPCQDLSGAGKRAGMTEGTRSNLWVQMREAIAVIKPTYVVWENVRGAYSAGADSEMESIEGRVGDAGGGEPVLRAIGRVLGDLSSLGYDCQWRGLRAADVGAPHGRFRVFVLATRQEPADTISAGLQGPHDPAGTAPAGLGGHPIEGAGADATDTTHVGHERARLARGRRDGLEDGSNPPADAERLIGDEGRVATPRQAKGGGASSRPQRRSGTRTEPETLGREMAWGEYGPAIRQWERTLGRPAPRPTEPTGRNGGHRLSARFCEWMMGAPDGWITDPAIGLTRNEQLKACGNGVVTLQAVAALQDVLS